MPTPAASSSGADSNGSAARNRQHNQGNQDRKYTVEQKAAVLRIRKCSPTAFYEILELSSKCTDAEIKKAYRKQSLLTHPDKNGHEHADEAFKMVARAFSVLGDKEKRDKFDRFGTDPDSRFGGGAAGPQQNPFSGFAGRRAASGGGPGQGVWEDEISPEEMFARFFGGGGFNTGGFGGGKKGHRHGHFEDWDMTTYGHLANNYCINNSSIRRRPTILLQLPRRCWGTSSPIRRRTTTSSATKSRATAGGG